MYAISACPDLWPSVFLESPLPMIALSPEEIESALEPVIETCESLQDYAKLLDSVFPVPDQDTSVSLNAVVGTRGDVSSVTSAQWSAIGVYLEQVSNKLKLIPEDEIPQLMSGYHADLQITVDLVVLVSGIMESGSNYDNAVLINQFLEARERLEFSDRLIGGNCGSRWQDPLFDANVAFTPEAWVEAFLAFLISE